MHERWPEARHDVDRKIGSVASDRAPADVHPPRGADASWDVPLEDEEMMSEDKTFTVTVNGDPVEIPRTDMTARKVLIAAGLDPKQRYLIAKDGNRTIWYKDNPDEAIHVHENQVFLTGRLGPVSVS